MLRHAVAPDCAAARDAAAAVRRFYAEQGASSAELFGCELCVAEACNNAVLHAAGAGRARPVSVEAVCSATQLELRVSDHTPGFDWPGKVALPGVRSANGRGLFIIQAYMDEVLYFRGPGENVLIMRKRRETGRAISPGPAPVLTPDQSRHRLNECERAVASLTHELRVRSETLSAVFHCCAELGRAGASVGFEERLLAEMLHLTAADWYVLRLVTPDRRRLVIAAVSSAELNPGPLALAAEGEGAGSLEVRVALSRVSARFDARACEPAEALRAAGTTANGVVYPLYFSDVLVGTVAVGRRAGDFAFGDLPEEVGRIFADFLAIQTAGLRSREEDLRTQLLARELDLAHVVQRSLLPVALPQMRGFGLAGGWHSAREIGGDFYDAIALSEYVSLLIVADVMGKGVPAALFAMNLRGLLRGLSALFEDPAQLLGRLNRLLFEELSAVSMFITAQVAVVDVRAGTVTAAGAGHGPLLYVAADGVSIGALAVQGLPLGIRADVEYRSQTIVLGRPGTLLLHTDGLTDMRNPAGETFGQSRLVAWLAANHGRGRSATELRGRLSAELKRYRGDAPMADDQAFLLLTEETRHATSRFQKIGRPRKATVAARAGAANH